MTNVTLTLLIIRSVLWIQSNFFNSKYFKIVVKFQCVGGICFLRAITLLRWFWIGRDRHVSHKEIEASHFDRDEILILTWSWHIESTCVPPKTPPHGHIGHHHGPGGPLPEEHSVTGCYHGFGSQGFWARDHLLGKVSQLSCSGFREKAEQASDLASNLPGHCPVLWGPSPPAASASRVAPSVDGGMNLEIVEPLEGPWPTKPQA